MVIGDYGYRKVIQLTGATADDLSAIVSLRWVVARPDGTRFERVLGNGDRDLNGNFTWLVQPSDLTVSGHYSCQAIDVTTGRQIATFISRFRVDKLL